MSFGRHKVKKYWRKSRRQVIDFYKDKGFGIVESSPYDNIYHCCVQKTASQWFKSVFNDILFYKYTGLPEQPYNQVGLKEDSYGIVPLRRVATPLYISYQDYLAIPKPSHYKTFFIMRDPRDIVVSFYFSTKYSHPLMNYIPRMRQELEEVDIKEGLKYVIHALEELSIFEALRSWANVNDEQHQVFKYEDLANNNRAFLEQLLCYLDIKLPPEKFDIFVNRHTFESHSKGRLQGKQDINSHYRKGISGDWKNYFEEEVMEEFNTVAGDLVDILGYEH
ncbi:MAG: sulfotransferase domain-containing protein [Cyanobacteria bacterium J06600_6]